ncbi:IS1595 family transposase [Candidatus Latescibacterota bacterium]
MDITKIYKTFPTQKACIKYLEKVRWNNKPQCPYCKSFNATPMPKEHRYHCNVCNTSYSVTVRTIFHKTKLDLQKWFLAISLILNAKKGISARQLARHLDVNKNTAWYMGMRIRRSMIEDRELMSGFVEMDETYVGGKPRKGDPPSKRGRGTKKTPVVGMVERGGNVYAKVQKKLNSKALSRMVKENIDISKSIIITDEFTGYIRLKRYARHRVINHQRGYVDGYIHTNTIEGFWALLKRGIIGQYHKVSVRYLNQYINEFCYRYNNRETDDLFGLTISNALGV